MVADAVFAKPFDYQELLARSINSWVAAQSDRDD